MEKERIVGLSILDEPVHRIKDIHARRLRARVRCVIRQDHDILLLVPMSPQEVAHVARIVHAAVQLIRQALVVNPDLTPRREYDHDSGAHRQRLGAQEGSM